MLIYLHIHTLQRLPLTLPELVQAAPSLTADGSLIVGRRESRVFVLDRSTGRPLATLSSDGGDQSGQLAWAGLSASGAAALDGLLLVGRQDYAVRSLRADTQAEAWNATFARVSLLRPGGSGGSGVRGFLAGLGAGSGGASSGGLIERPPAAAGAWVEEGDEILGSKPSSHHL